jgi:arylsulfatase A-like enzyme
MTDDQGHDTLTDQFMPHTKSMIADRGITFTRAYIPTAICCPSRASFLTGKYARNHGVRTNQHKLLETTVADRLQRGGYFTGLVGKYLNSWPGDSRPEFNYWACWRRGFINPEMNVFGDNRTVNGYITDILRDHALDFLDRLPADKPFFLLFAPNAPHGPATPSEENETLYSDLPPWRPPNFNPEKQPGKPDWVLKTDRLNEEDIENRVDRFRLKQLRSLKSVDSSVRDILNHLSKQGKLDNTLVVFYSDNGYFWGEHRLLHKERAYEEASRVPFAIRYTALITKPRKDNRLVSVIDLAPTIYELAGVQLPADVDGRSLIPLMQETELDPSEWRDALLLEGWPGLRREHVGNYQAIRTDRYVYIETYEDKPELYDTLNDPFQLRNLIDDPALRKTAKRLRKRLHRYHPSAVRRLKSMENAKQ